MSIGYAQLSPRQLTEWTATKGPPICYTSATFAIIFVKAGTLDDVSDLKPTTHYWVQSAQNWVPLPGDAKLVQQE